MRGKQLHYWVLPIALFIAVAPFTAHLDIAISHLFFQDNHFYNTVITRNIFVYGLLPAWIFSIIGFLLTIGSFFSQRLRSYRPMYLLLWMSLLIGSGIISNGIFKEYWGRPRPVQIEEFGGPANFRTFFQPLFFHTKEAWKSFPSGHATMGFYFFSVFIIGKRYRNRWLTIFGITLTTVMGTMLSVTRIAQGGHFFSDIFASAIIMWYTVLILDILLHKRTLHHERSYETTTRHR